LFDRHPIFTDKEIAMMNELELFTEAASSNTFVYLSVVFALAYAAWTVWLIGQAPTQRALQASMIRRAL
jgi:hypothetical protein